MAVRGTKPKPALTVVREGNPGKRPVREGVVLPPADLVEPIWAQLLPGNSVEGKAIRKSASDLWLQLAPVLSRSVGLVRAQQETLVDYCVTYARIVQGERALAREGVVVQSKFGAVKNPWTTVLNQYRAHFRSLVGELGLSPSAATRLTRPDGGDDEDPFD